VTTWTDFDMRQTISEEQQLYDHLLYCVQVESPRQMILRFCRLFWDGSRYEDQQIWFVLEKLAVSKQAEQEFKFILNRCCHILINRWRLQPQLQWAIPELVAVFEKPPALQTVQSRGARRLRHLVKLFRETEQYLKLRRLSKVLSGTTQASESASQEVGALIQRYPYLYEHCLLSEDSSYEHQQAVRQIRCASQRRFEFDLSHYVTYQVRCAHARRNHAFALPTRAIQPVSNPTLLSDGELGAALKHFVGKVDRVGTYRDFAQSFITHSRQTSSYKNFKDDLYEYLTASIDSGYGRRHFNDQLYSHLKSTFIVNDHQKPSEFLLVRTCSRLLNFLVVESPQRPNHYIFVDLTTNLGATATTGLLLKIVLVCGKVRPSLEKRFAILFNHYESSNREGVPWLVKSMENVNIALSVHFGSADLSCLNQIM